MSSSNYLDLASAHVNSLIDYVLDTKPYHVKLSQVIDEYLFEENVTVTAVEGYLLTIFLGADLVDTDLDLGTRPRSNTWNKVLRSNGLTRVYQLPLVSHPKFLSHLSQERFTVGTDDYFGIPGLSHGSLVSPYTVALSPRRWDGPGITTVTKAGSTIQEGWQYFISHGVFSFNTLGSNTWKESNTNPNLGDANTDIDTALNAGFDPKDGTLAYEDVYKSYGSITSITSNVADADYEEWILECTDDTPGNLELTVYKGSDPTTAVGVASFLVPFAFSDATSSISFTFGEMFDDPPLTEPPIAIGDTFLLTPSAKITVHPDAPLEIWSLIKVNPACLKTPVTFTPLVAGTNYPGLQVFCRDLHLTPASYWEITFTDTDTFSLSAWEYDELTDTVGAMIAGYPKTVELIDGCAFKDDLIHFCFIPTTRGFLAGDEFNFRIGADKPTFMVFGSTSGFDGRATIGEWFWNGKIGFKVPELKCFSLAFSPTIAVASDGLSYLTVVSSDQVLSEVTYVNSNQGFITTGDGSIVASSIGGYSWQSDVTSLAMDGQRAIVIGENGFIAMTTLVSGFPTPTFEWYERVSHTTEDLNALVFIPGFFISPPPTIEGIFVVCGDNGTIITSANGDAWAVKVTGITENLNDIDWAGTPANIMVAVGDNGTIITSTDTIVWNVQVSGTTENLTSVIYAEDIGTFFAVGNNGTVRSSTDGVVWSVVPIATADNLLDIAYRPIDLPDYPNGQLVIIGEEGTVASSVDVGVTWTLGTTAPFKSIAFSPDEGIFVVVGGGPVQIGQFSQLTTVHPMAEPSVYTVTFISATQAVVKNNLYGWRSGLTVNVPWSDEFVSFTITNTPQAFVRGDVVKVYLSPSATFPIFGGYDELPYDTFGYDTGSADLEVPRYLHQYFPLWHSHGVVIIGDTDQPAEIANRVAVSAAIVIDKALFDIIRFRLPSASAVLTPELASIDGWLPLEFRYVDRLDVNDDPISTAEFSDVATRIDAYLASDPTYLVFSLTQPRYLCTNRAQSCIMTLSEDFVSDFLPAGTNFTVQVIPQESYGQRVRVKITENLSFQINYVDATPDVLVEIETPPVPPTSPQLNEETEEFEAGVTPPSLTVFPLTTRTIPYLVTAVELNAVALVEGVDYTVDYVGDVVTLLSPAVLGDILVVTVLEFPM